MKSLFFLLLSLLLVGCATSSKQSSPPPPIREVVTGEIVHYSTIENELRPLMSEEYDPKLVLMDAQYGAVSEEATRKIIAEAFLTFHFDYVEEANDCDDGAIQLTVLLRSIFRRDTASVPLAAPIGLIGGALVGDIPELKFVSPGFPLYHAMVAVRCQGGKWLLVEPASKQVTELTGPIYEGSFELFVGIF